MTTKIFRFIKAKIPENRQAEVALGYDTGEPHFPPLDLWQGKSRRGDNKCGPGLEHVGHLSQLSPGNAATRPTVGSRTGQAR